MTAGEVCGSEIQMQHSVFAQSMTTVKTFPSKRILNLREQKYCRRDVVCRPDGLLCLYRGKKKKREGNIIKTGGLFVFFGFYKCFLLPVPLLPLSVPFHIFYFSFNQRSQCKVFYKLTCWLAGSLTWRLPNVVRSPPARRSRKFNHYWCFAPHSRGFYNTQRSTTDGRTPLDEWSARHTDLYLTTQNTHNRQTSMPPGGIRTTISAGERP
jgi:hypothetical protein